MVEDYNPDVVITDIVLPGLDGISLIRKIREKNMYPMMAIITENPNNQVTKMAYNYGAQILILKPFDVENLVFQIRDLYDLNLAKKNIYIEIPRSSRESYNKRKIEKLLLKIGIPANRIGYNFILSSLMLELEKPHSMDMVTKTLYPVLAKNYGSSVSNIERGINYVIGVAWENTNIEKRKEIYGNSINPQKAHPTNGEFLATLMQILRLDGLN